MRCARASRYGLVHTDCADWGCARAAFCAFVPRVFFRALRAYLYVIALFLSDLLCRDAFFLRPHISVVVIIIISLVLFSGQLKKYSSDGGVYFHAFSYGVGLGVALRRACSESALTCSSSEHCGGLQPHLAMVRTCEGFSPPVQRY